ncbi:hypothetical protein FB451DRAFT_1570130 [Mycena latifolia]|nr:hypothetical protein FB451DRAFT_1570130 [Mycena latifolia]
MAADANESQSNPPMVSDPVQTVFRDAKHYHPTGDCIIRVQNTLFKIHKFHLVHNSSVFAGMFDIPSGEQQEEGKSDDSPIVLEGEKAFGFRSVLKYMYAGGMGMQIDVIPLSALREIIAVAEFAEKYEMADLKEWALSFIYRRIFGPPTGKAKQPLMDLPEQDLAALHELYCRLDGDVACEYRDLIMATWCTRVEKNRLPIAGVLRAAEASEQYTYLAELYCVQLRRMKGHARVLTPTPFPTDDIPPVHLQRIYAGYCSLSLAWDRLREVGVHYPHQPGTCPSERHHTKVCVSRLEKRWKEAISASESIQPDVTRMQRRLDLLVRYLRKHTELEDGRKWECFARFSGPNGALAELADDFILPAHFFPGLKLSIIR